MFDYCHYQNIHFHSQNRCFKELTKFRRRNCLDSSVCLREGELKSYLAKVCLDSTYCSRGLPLAWKRRPKTSTKLYPVLVCQFEWIWWIKDCSRPLAMCSEEFVALELREKSWIKESSMKTTVSTQPLTTRGNIYDISLLRVNVSQENVFSTYRKWFIDCKRTAPSSYRIVLLKDESQVVQVCSWLNYMHRRSDTNFEGKNAFLLNCQTCNQCLNCHKCAGLSCVPNNPRDLWQLRHWLQFLQLRTWTHDNLYYLTIKSDSGQYSQFLRCFMTKPKNI